MASGYSRQSLLRLDGADFGGAALFRLLLGRASRLAGELQRVWALFAPKLPHLLLVLAAAAFAVLGVLILTGAEAPQSEGLLVLFLCLSFGAVGVGAHVARSRAACAERELALYREAFTGAESAVLHWDFLDGDLNWRGDVASLLKVQKSEVPLNFRDLRDFLHPDESLFHAISHALKTGARAVVWQLRVKDGEAGWRSFELRGRIEIPSGRPKFVGIMAPVAEAQSHSRADSLDVRIAEVVEAVPISFALWDSGQHLLFCNRKFRQLYGLSTEAAAPGTSLANLQARAKQPILQAPAEHRGVAGRFQVRERQLKDESWLQIREFWTGDGLLASVATDITVSKLAERRIFEREQQMRMAVADFEQTRRQLEVQARQLRELAESYNEEKIRAEAANRAKSEFLANVSHELRTPLNAIIGFSEMMRDGVLGPIGNAKYASYVNDINASGRYLLEMISDILDMSKIEAGRVTLSPEWIMLGPIFDDCLKVVHPSSAERKVQLIQAGNSNLSMFGDRRAVKQIVINLLSNAVKFTMPGGKVMLRAYRYRGSLRIAITDTGVGIPKHDLGRIGKPFEQVENQLTKGHKGTGLGLAISRSLVELHGGKLEIRSKVGEGTTVTCVFPLHDERDLGQEAA